MQVLPSKELSILIRHYLFLESEEKKTKKLRFFSDGNTGIVFSLKNSLISNFKNHRLSENLPDTFVYGQLTEYKDIVLAGETSLIIVVFQPSGLNQLMGIPAGKIQDNIIKTEDLFGRQGIELQEKLSEQTNNYDRLNILNAFFSKIIDRKKIEADLFTQTSLNLIGQYKGLISVNQLVRYTGYTERHIERKFMESIGLNPKLFINIVKLHSFLRYWKEHPVNETITAIAYEAGYSDQSHLIKEFKKYTGMTPREYFINATKLAVNFVERL